MNVETNDPRESRSRSSLKRDFVGAPAVREANFFDGGEVAESR